MQSSKHLFLISVSKAASMVNTKEIPPEAILLGVYLELQNGESHIETVITQGLLGSIAIYIPEGGQSPFLTCNHLSLQTDLFFE